MFGLLALSCNTSGLKRVYIAPDSQGTVERTQFAAGAPIFCVADVAIGDAKVGVRVSMRPTAIGGQPAHRGLNAPRPPARTNHSLTHTT